tara:strand:- start:8957 stop:10879 length:1923 start_codon:yes stop_codon:yes gene_type:complete
MHERDLDVIALGRSSVDLYGDQEGLPLSDMSSFSSYVGGCATNIAVGASRLGLKSGLISRVGNEQMGQFIRRTLVEEGVDVAHVSTDPKRLTALVVLGIRNRSSFPHIFYRENCADMALSEGDIDPAYIARARALVLTGTHFSQPGVEAASRKAIRAARQAGTKIALDIDYRPVAWGLTSHGDGENRFVESAPVTEHLQSIVADCDLIVGTEEEIRIAGGQASTIDSLKALRALTAATLVTKRGPLGCSVFPGDIPTNLDEGVAVAGREIEVYNTLGAGDGFMSGFLCGWVANESWETCCAYGNASGALVVSRHGCAPAIPSREELQYYLAHGSAHHRLREDPVLERLHRVTTGRKPWPELCVLAFDHRWQLEELAAAKGAKPEAIAALKGLFATAAQNVAADSRKIGVIIDDVHGFDALADCTGSDLWIARPVELPGSVPLQFQHGDNIMETLRAWPRSHVVKCLVQYHPADPDDVRLKQEEQVLRLQAACIATDHELLLEVVPDEARGNRDDAVVQSVRRFYEIGVLPDWWKLPPPKSPEHWADLESLIAQWDPHCRGVLLLGLNVAPEILAADFALSADHAVCKGFAVGRTLINGPAEEWLSGRADAAQTIAAVEMNFKNLITVWNARDKASRRTPA